MSDTMKELGIQRTTAIFKKEERRERGILEQMEEYLTHNWFTPSVYPLFCAHHKNGPIDFVNDALSLISHRHPPSSISSILSYQTNYIRYRVEEGQKTYKNIPFCLNMTPTDEYVSTNANRICYYNDIPYVSYTVIYCLTRDETLNGGHLVFYPNYEEELAPTNLLKQYMTQCSMAQHELDLPLTVGSVIVLSGDVYHAIQPFTGHGDCILLMVDLYLHVKK